MASRDNRDINAEKASVKGKVVPPPPTFRKRLSDLDGGSGATSNLDDKFPMKFPFPPGNSFKEGTDISPSLSLRTSMEFASVCSPNLSNAPLMPDIPPVLGLGAVHTSQMLSNNHKKVLDNIMMRTRTAAHKFWKKRLKVDVWSEDELDALWIGVRRHGRGNWDAILRDPKLNILRCKSVEDLSSKWIEEQCNILDVPGHFPKIPNFDSGLFPGTMTSVLPGSKFSSIGQESPVSHSHLSDIKLACEDLLPKFWSLGKSNEPVGMFGMLNRPEKINVTSDQFVYQNPVPGGFFGASGIILPNLHQRPRDIHCGESTKKQFSGKQSVDDRDFPGSSRANVLPHWLQNAVNVSSNSSVLELSPSASAIMHSIRVLYDEVEPKIPPFVVPGPPPFLPKDPRKISRNKRKLDRVRQAMSDASCSESIGNNSSAPPLLPHLMGSFIPLEQRNLSPPLLSLNLNLNSPSKDALFPTFSGEKCKIPASKDPESSQQSVDDLNTKQKALRSSDLDLVNLVSRNAESDSWRGVDVEEVPEISSEEAGSHQNCEGS